MSIENGIYEIKSILTGDTIGRHIVEDFSKSPKNITVQSGPGFQPGSTHWIVESKGGGYILRAGGVGTGVRDENSDEVVAIPTEGFGGQSRQWILRPVGYEDTYHICNPNGENSIVWTVSDTRNAPLEGGKIIILAELEPSSNKQVFAFTKVAN